MTRRELFLLLGGAMTASPGVRAQQKAMPVIGFLGGTTSGAFAPAVAAFRQGLSETGFVEGQTWRSNTAGRRVTLIGCLYWLPTLSDARSPSSWQPAMLRRSRRRMRPRRSRSSFSAAATPVATGLAASLARPGGNLTGIGIMVVELMQKRVELLTELVPQARAIALLMNPNDPQAERFSREVQGAAHAKRLQLDIMRAPKARSMAFLPPSVN